MQQQLFPKNANDTANRTRYILVIDDSGPMRAALARQIMLACTSYNYSCAIFRLGERAEPSLTYFSNPHRSISNPEERTVVDFAIYEASSPRHALTWIQETRIKHLTIISDVLMPIDTEVGLSGLINGLNKLQIAVNLLFISSEAQSRQYISPLLEGKQAYFLVKGSEVWSRLPEALVMGANRFTYKVPTKQTDAFGPQFGRPLSPTRPAMAMATGNMMAQSQMAMVNQTQKSPGFWSRLMQRIAG